MNRAPGYHQPKKRRTRFSIVVLGMCGILLIVIFFGIRSRLQQVASGGTAAGGATVKQPGGNSVSIAEHSKPPDDGRLLKEEVRDVAEHEKNSHHGPGDEENDYQSLPMCEKIEKQLLREANRARALALGGHAGVSPPLRPFVEPHLFVVWHDAMSKLETILRDIEKRFPVLAIQEFSWTNKLDAGNLTDRKKDKKGPLSSDGDSSLEGDRFLINLWRLYSGKGGWAKVGMKLKVKQCGRGNFVAVVVLDANPVYATEKTAHGDDVVNVKMNKQKTMYRRLAGGGFRVHGTFNPTEAFHDITLLFHRTPTTLLEESRERLCTTSLSESTINNSPSSKKPTIIEASATLVSNFLSNRDAFLTQNETLGLSSSLAEQSWDTCEDLQLALSTIPDVALFPHELNTDTKKQKGSNEAPLQWNDCANWPMRLQLRVPAKSIWAAVAIINPVAVDPEMTEHTPPGIFEVIIAKQRRVIRIKPL